MTLDLSDVVVKESGILRTRVPGGLGFRKQRGAVFSPCERWRYALWNVWSGHEDPRIIAYVGLNPSTADEMKDDPTIRRCRGFAEKWGWDGMVMLNAFAFRSTDPKGLKTIDDPVGAETDLWLARLGQSCGVVVACWGVHCDLNRERAVCGAIGRKMRCFGRTKDGKPKHPLYLPGSSTLIQYWSGRFES